MKRSFAALLILLSVAPAYASPRIEIDTDEDDCIKGWISMDVTVTVDGERFAFDPSCKFSFDKTFKTSKGVSCKVEAGMCSSFSPHNKIEVTCDHTTESVGVSCP